MATNGIERALRRLREHQDKLESPVGMRILGLAVKLWRTWSDDLGQIRCVRIELRPGWHINLFGTRNIARGLIGPDWLTAYEQADPEHNTVLYVQCIDRRPQPRQFSLVPARRNWLDIWPPRYVRWFDARKLGVGLGDQDNGAVTIDGFSFSPG